MTGESAFDGVVRADGLALGRNRAVTFLRLRLSMASLGDSFGKIEVDPQKTRGWSSVDVLARARIRT